MQTEAEKYLISLIANLVKRARSAGQKLKIINLGAAKSTIVEEAVIKEVGAGLEVFVCDRCDIQDCAVGAPYAQQSFVCPLEDMTPIPDATYDVAFANFVLEHVQNPQRAANEMARIVKPGGELILSLSNPQAPEFILARLTPTRFHQLFRQEGHDEAYPVKYAYKSLSNLLVVMANAGWKLKEERNLPATYSYLHRFPVFGWFSRIYDFSVLKFKLKPLLGHAVMYWQKVDKSL